MDANGREWTRRQAEETNRRLTQMDADRFPGASVWFTTPCLRASVPVAPQRSGGGVLCGLPLLRVHSCLPAIALATAGPFAVVFAARYL